VPVSFVVVSHASKCVRLDKTTAGGLLKKLAQIFNCSLILDLPPCVGDIDINELYKGTCMRTRIYVMYAMTTVVRHVAGLASG
jgi:hypothetical protein